MSWFAKAILEMWFMNLIKVKRKYAVVLPRHFCQWRITALDHLLQLLTDLFWSHRSRDTYETESGWRQEGPSNAIQLISVVAKDCRNWFQMRNYQTLQPQEPNISQGSLGCQSGRPWWMWNHSIVVQRSYWVCLVTDLNLNKQNEGRTKQPCMLEHGTSMIFPENLKENMSSFSCQKLLRQTAGGPFTCVHCRRFLQPRHVLLWTPWWQEKWSNYSAFAAPYPSGDALENSNNQGPQQPSKFQNNNTVFQSQIYQVPYPLSCCNHLKWLIFYFLKCVGYCSFSRTKHSPMIPPLRTTRCSSSLGPSPPWT